MAGLSRAMRLNRPEDFSRVFRQGKRYFGAGLTVIVVENSEEYPRLGLAIAKKHIKRASQRNRLKRIIRESFRLNQSKLSSIDIVVLSGPTTLQHDDKQIWTTLSRHWISVAAQWQKSS